MPLDDVAPERLPRTERRLDVDVGTRVTRSPSVVRRSVSATAWKRTRPPSTDSAVRHTPPIATESPTAVDDAVSGASTTSVRPASSPSVATTRPTSRTIPVNTTSRLPRPSSCRIDTARSTRRAAASRAGRRRPTLLDVGPPRSIGSGSSPEHRGAAAGEHRRDEDEQPVDEAVGEEGGRDRRPTLEEERLGSLARRARPAPRRAGRLRSSRSEPGGSGPRPKARRRGWRTHRDVPHVETRCVGAHRAHPHADRVDRRAELVDAPAGLLAGHPAAARDDHPAVERDRELEGHVRARRARPTSATPRSAVVASRQVEQLDLDPGAAKRARLRLAPRRSGRGNAATTRAMPAATIRSTHGGVRPWCAQGSIVTWSVAPRAASPAASSATISACRPPAGSVTPSPSVLPSALRRRRPPSGSGTAAAARLRPARARARCSRDGRRETAVRRGGIRVAEDALPATKSDAPASRSAARVAPRRCPRRPGSGRRRGMRARDPARAPPA